MPLCQEPSEVWGAQSMTHRMSNLNYIYLLSYISIEIPQPLHRVAKLQELNSTFVAIVVVLVCFAPYTTEAW